MELTQTFKQQCIFVISILFVVDFMEISLISRSVYKNVLFLSQAPGAPSRVVFSEVTGSSVNVSWGVPLQPNGVVEGYRVVYEPTAPVHGEQDGEKTTLL